ncbi:hypothetical protein [Algoriphagus confluentis]|uniref:VLRF1 domain-containing protein n=1 Tax=Algoriphagus confluentis TaxID=1697556 RepID=A0ABQ6PM53_9BACT|nr:hypothetical protein Aconfl_12450 [Algoriphagus confluentis]
MIKIPDSLLIDQKIAQEILLQAQVQGMQISYFPSKHQLLIEREQAWLAKIFLSWTTTWSENQGFSRNEDAHFALALIKSGQAAVGYFHRGQLEDHKVFRAYMVRKKQGKSQIKHLKTKGKSRAGSRIRLEETLRFFEEINERLNAYDHQFPLDFWGISCSKTLWPFLFSSSSPPPFSSDSRQLIELPFHVSQASFEELQQAGKLLSGFHLLLSEAGKKFFSALFNSKEESEEDW